MRVKIEFRQKLTYSLMCFCSNHPYFLFDLFLNSVNFSKLIGIFPFEISKCPYICELFLSTRAS
jgi:hypothetical protein